MESWELRWIRGVGPCCQPALLERKAADRACARLALSSWYIHLWNSHRATAPAPSCSWEMGCHSEEHGGSTLPKPSLWALSSRGRHRLSPSVSGMEVLIKRMEMGCGNGPCRGSVFYSQQPHGGSQPPVSNSTSAMGGSDALF